jgi:hypothetical protein
MTRAVTTTRFSLLSLLPLLGLLSGCSLFDTGYPLAEALQREGTPAQATILSIEHTGTSINEQPVVRLEVKVQPPDGPAYEATIKRLLISDLEIPQYQPGNVIAVRYDPRQPSRVSIDLGPPKAAMTGEPFQDNYQAEIRTSGPVQPPGPDGTAIYRGGNDEAADKRALYENDYAPLGASNFTAAAAADPQAALRQGQRVKAALVVLYGTVQGTPDGVGLRPLPFHPRPAGYTAVGAPAADTNGARATIGLLPPLPAAQHVATYWAKTPPPILGVLMRALDENEKGRLLRNDGIVIELVANDSPAAAAHLQPGDIVLAIDGKPILDLAAMPAFLGSVAGHKVRLDLLRGGAPLSVELQLNPASPR